MLRIALRVAAASALLSATAFAQGKFPPDSATNLQVLPDDIPMRQLIGTMQNFTRALGVRCTFCHVGQEGQPLTTYDFASDRKPEKETARRMLQMVGAINGEHLAKLASRSEPRVEVTCMTCHRGVSQPRPLQQVLLAKYDAGGIDSVETLYRSLRQRYYGAAAYDFGEVPLADVASALRARDRLDDAIRLHALNTEFSPTSGFAFRQAAEAYLAKRDTASAIARLEKALAINANDQQAKRMLDALRKP